MVRAVRFRRFGMGTTPSPTVANIHGSNVQYRSNKNGHETSFSCYFMGKSFF